MYYIHDPETGVFRFTTAGLQKYQARFFWAGIDINHIRMAEQFNRALDLSFRDVLIPEWAAEVRRKLPSSLERNYLLAVLEGDVQEGERLKALIQRQNTQFGRE